MDGTPPCQRRPVYVSLVVVCVHGVCMGVWASGLFLAALSIRGSVRAWGRGARVPHALGP